MKTMGLLISHKNKEGRRALLPEDVSGVRNKAQLFFETGYGESLFIDDAAYAATGAHIVSREEALACDVICDVKLGNADYIESLTAPKLLFGWAHAVQMADFTSAVLRGGHTVLAWENIYESNRYVFYRNREVAGEAAVLHAFRYCGKMPYDTRVAIFGRGQTSKGALRILHGLGAQVDVYTFRQEELFKKNLPEYDVIINCVLWDVTRTDRVIYRADLQRMKKGALIIDVSCDQDLEIETAHPTTIDDPVYTVDGVVHYAVDNTPALFPYTATRELSQKLCAMIDPLLEGKPLARMKKAVVIENGHILDESITQYRQARGLFVQ
ncbi:MAG: N(5)-(carboxyethyl)ornithine synthase [Clostridia bacterium]|nr:N(5)-(carboxyethyl)ornithine synthase [Clostridia bacterium]